MIDPKYFQLQDSQLEWPHRIYQRISICLLYWFYCLIFSIHVHGRENRPKTWRPYIVASNHSSNVDPPLIAFALYYQPLSFMAKMELFETPFLRTFNWAMSSFAVNRQKLSLSTIKSALKVLKHGKWALALFPEGTRNKDGQVMEDSKRGVAYFAKAAQVPVLPLAVVYSDLARDDRSLLFFWRKKRADVWIGSLIPPEDDLDSLSKKIQQSIQTLAQQTH